MIHKVKVHYDANKDGKPEAVEVEVDDDVEFGKVAILINNLVKVEDIARGKVAPDIYKFITGLLPAVVVKAPWDTSSSDWLSKLPFKTARELIKEVSEFYPLGDYLEDMVSMMLKTGVLKRKTANQIK